MKRPTADRSLLRQDAPPLFGLILGCDSSGSPGPAGAPVGAETADRTVARCGRSAGVLGSGFFVLPRSACCSGICDISTGTAARRSHCAWIPPPLPVRHRLLQPFVREAASVRRCIDLRADNAACTSSAACCSGNCFRGFLQPSQHRVQDRRQPLCGQHRSAALTCAPTARAHCRPVLHSNRRCRYRGSGLLLRPVQYDRRRRCGRVRGTCPPQAPVAAPRTVRCVEDCTTVGSALCLPFARTGVRSASP